MKPFFKDTAVLVAECNKWRGTPWRKCSGGFQAAPGVGGDCVTIAASIYEACGFSLEGFKPALPNVLMAPDAARQFVLSPLNRLATFGRAAHLPMVPKHSVIAGDLLLLEFGAMLSLGIAVGDSRFFATAARPGGCWNIHTLDAKVAFDALTDAWRPLEDES